MKTSEVYCSRKSGRPTSYNEDIIAVIFSFDSDSTIVSLSVSWLQGTALRGGGNDWNPVENEITSTLLPASMVFT